MRKYVIMGPQGSGKGTQAGMLARGFDLVHISVGDIFRWHVQNRTKLGTRVKRYMHEGRLVPDEMVAPNLDRDQFRQVLINLIQNAVEAMPAERAGGSVTIQGEPTSGGGVRLVVADDGAGIPGEAVAKIFEPLFTTKTKGTGLGLAIVANMVRAHAGTIRVESQPGKGSTFIIRLPNLSRL